MTLLSPASPPETADDARRRASSTSFESSAGGCTPSVVLEDLVDEYLRRVENPPVGQVVNLIDDEPRMREFAELMMPMFGKEAGSMPLWIASLMAGKSFPEMLASSFRGRNDRAKSMLGWTPKHPQIRTRLADVVREYNSLAKS